MNVLAITQARFGSSRLPAKVLMEIGGVSLLEMHLRRINQSKLIDDVIVATTTEPESVAIVDIAKKTGAKYYQGSISDVLSRFYEVAKEYRPKYIVRLTSDCPIIDATVIDKVIARLVHNDYDYVSNGLSPTYPDGISVEAFTYDALEKAHFKAILPSEREHVTPYIWKNSTWKGGDLFKSDCVQNDTDYSKYRLTVDTQEDFDLISELVNNLGPNEQWMEYVSYIEKNEIYSINSRYSRNEGYSKSVLTDIKG